MTPAFRFLPLLLGLLAPLPGARLASASPPSADTAALQFQGFRAGARLEQLDTLVRRFGGGRLRCDRAKADRRVTECRASLTDPALGGSVSLWVSAIDSVAGVITLSSGVSADQLDRWRQLIERRYGRVDARVQGSQWMMQWVRQGRMLRLTWRIDRGGKVASVSLVDGRVLDAWGRSRGTPQRS
jgi:hypothetical protein